ncbi:uncharacterized protein LOC133032257 [Cannabis sativa]|uniref:uncharacterized protein LOC133032257 n=1 Tax=Cannabis sativa TaxID=3483 RepID=UPI0029CA5AB3|nr:uncharacterized protein LOC133032257 [Cannabis sativa]
MQPGVASARVAIAQEDDDDVSEQTVENYGGRGQHFERHFCNWLLVLFSRCRPKEMEEAAVVSWSIWRACNDFFWQQRSRTAANVGPSTRTLLDQYKSTQKEKGLSLSLLIDGNRVLERWTAPAINKIKVNVDDALFEREGRFGFGCVARDSSNNLVEAYTMGKVGWV